MRSTSSAYQNNNVVWKKAFVWLLQLQIKVAAFIHGLLFYLTDQLTKTNTVTQAWTSGNVFPEMNGVYPFKDNKWEHLLPVVIFEIFKWKLEFQKIFCLPCEPDNLIKHFSWDWLMQWIWKSRCLLNHTLKYFQIYETVLPFSLHILFVCFYY